MKIDTLIRCGHLLTLKNGDCSAIADGMVAVTGTKIVKVGSWDPKLEKQAKRVVNATKKIVMPGLVNGHCHLPMSLFRGLADDLSFDEWLHKYILPLERRLVSPEFVKLGTELSLLESIRAGVTTIFDMYFFEKDIAEVVDRSGLRAVLGESVMDFPAPDNPKLDGNEFRILDEMLDVYGAHERINVIAAPHAPYSCSDETLKKVVAYCDNKNMGLGIHVSETRGEFEGSQKQYQQTPVERMKRLGVTRESAIFAHCVHLTDDDIKILADTKTSAIHNPESNMKLGVGISPIPRLLKAGVCVGIGTDGPASNNDLSIFSEMDVAAKLQKLNHFDPTAMTAAQALRMATFEGARAMKLGDQCGSLEEGKFADLIVLDAQVPHLQPIHDLASQIVYSAKDADVESVMVHGKWLMENHQVLTICQDDVFERVNAYREKNKF